MKDESWGLGDAGRVLQASSFSAFRGRKSGEIDLWQMEVVRVDLWQDDSGSTRAALACIMKIAVNHVVISINMICTKHLLEAQCWY